MYSVILLSNGCKFEGMEEDKVSIHNFKPFLAWPYPNKHVTIYSYIIIFPLITPLSAPHPAL